MRADVDPDLLLVQRMLAPPPLDEARRSLDYWRRRRAGLPLYRRGARREAAEMTALWEERVRTAEQARFHSSVAGRLLAALGFSMLWSKRPDLSKRGAAVFVWSILPFRLKVVTGAVGALAAVLCAGVLVLLVEALAQLA